MTGTHVVDDYIAGTQRTYVQDWSKFLADGEVIASATAAVVVPDGDQAPLVLNAFAGTNATHDDTTTRIEWSAGTAGVRYPITVTITTTVTGDRHSDRLIVDTQP
ncbi:MAG: hypothetical protein AAGA99_26360 [Actinomycetota bacterium]